MFPICASIICVQFFAYYAYKISRVKYSLHEKAGVIAANALREARKRRSPNRLCFGME